MGNIQENKQKIYDVPMKFGNKFIYFGGGAVHLCQGIGKYGVWVSVCGVLKRNKETNKLGEKYKGQFALA